MASSHAAVCPRAAALGDAARRAPLGESKRSSVPWGGRSRSARRVVTRAPTPRDVRVSVHTPPAHDSGVDDGLDVAEMRARLKQKQQALMEKLGIAECRKKRPGQLSGGESQRAAIARALANDPAVILADEPTGNLDTRNSEIVFQTFAELASEGERAIVAVTHDPEMAAFCSRRVRLVDGRIASDG